VAVPDFQSLMRPFLVILEDGEDHSIRTIREQLAEQLCLTQADIEQMLPSGKLTTVQNRVTWAATYLYRTRLVDRPKRAVYRITDRGRAVLEQNPERVNVEVLSRFKELKDFQAR
jgi:restriction system protein